MSKRVRSWTHKTVRGEESQDLFAVVDRLSSEIKKDLALPVTVVDGEDRPVAEVTTYSPEAYKCLLEGLDNRYKFYMEDAKTCFLKAVNYDSTFPMAYYNLALLTYGPEREGYLSKAVRYSHRAGERERLYINRLDASVRGDIDEANRCVDEIISLYPDEKEAFYLKGSIQYSRGEFEQAVASFEKAIDIDPLYKLAYNTLAYCNNEIGNFEESIRAIDQYVKLAPGEANPYDSRGDLLAFNGRIDEAIDSYKKALEIKPELLFSKEKLGHMYLFKRDYAEAEKIYRELSASESKDARRAGNFYQTYIPLMRGRFDEALAVLDRVTDASRLSGSDRGHDAKIRRLRGFILMERGDLEGALQSMKEAAELNVKHSEGMPNFSRISVAVVMAAKGEIETAEEIAQDLEREIEAWNPDFMYPYWEASGSIAFAKKDYSQAIEMLSKARYRSKSFATRYFLARAYLESRLLDEGIAEFESALARYDTERLNVAAWSVRGHFLLAGAYDETGEKDKAIAQYEEFLAYWGDEERGEGDPVTPEIEEARRRLKELRKST